LLQRQWARTAPDGDIEDDDDDDDDDDDAEDEDVDEVYGTPLLPPTPPSVARPTTKKFKSAATIATAAVGGKKKKKSPSIIKNTAATGASSLLPQWRLQAKRKPLISDKSSAMHTAYTTPGEPGSFGGARRLFVGMLFDRHDTQRYLRTQDVYTLHRQVRRRFPRRKMLSKGITVSSTCRVC